VAKIVPAPTGRRDMRKVLPNLVSILRFPLAALFVAADGIGARFVAVALAALTDWVDGPLARRTGTASRTGEWLDPLADKTFMVAALITLVLERGIALWTLPLLLLRDIGVALGALVLLVRRERATLAARRLGKWVTWMQFLAIGAILLRPALAPWTALPLATLGAAALVDYGRALRAGSASPMDRPAATSAR